MLAPLPQVDFGVSQVWRGGKSPLAPLTGTLAAVGAGF